MYPFVSVYFPFLEYIFIRGDPIHFNDDAESFYDGILYDSFSYVFVNVSEFSGDADLLGLESESLDPTQRLPDCYPAAVELGQPWLPMRLPDVGLFRERVFAPVPL
jgi:hypothetical protein